MTIYFSGGEDTSWGTLVSAVFSATAGVFRSSFARIVLQITTTVAAYPPPAYAQTPNWTPVSSFWCHARHSNYTTNAPSISNSTSLNFVMLALQDAAGVGRILLRGTGSVGQFKISTRNAAGTITDLVTSAVGAIPVSTPNVSGVIAVDVFVNYAVAGQIAVYINGVNVCDTGTNVNVTTDGATTLASLMFSSIVNFNLSVDSFPAYWSEILVQDTTTLGAAVFTIPPVAAGNTQSFLPNTVGNINPTSINDAVFIYDPAINALSEWTVATTPPSGSWSIGGIVLEARTCVGATGPQHFAWLARTSDGSDNAVGSVAPVIGSFANYATILQTNPHTGVGWNFGELINIGVKSLT